MLDAFDLHPFLSAATQTFEVPGVDRSVSAEVLLVRTLDWLHHAYPFYESRRNAPGGDLRLYLRPLCALIEQPWTLEWPFWRERSSKRVNRRYQRRDLEPPFSNALEGLRIRKYVNGEILFTTKDMGQFDD